MIWGTRRSDDDNGVEHTRNQPRPDFTKQPSDEKLPQRLQRLVDRDDDFDELYSQYSVDSTDTSYRYAGYANRIRTLMLSAHRYVAYTSDIGESFRPVSHPWIVRSAYAVSWAYILGDVAHEGYKAYLRNRHILAPPGESYKNATNLIPVHILRGMTTGNISGPLSSNSSYHTHDPNLQEDSGDGDIVPWRMTCIPLIEDYRVVMAKRAVFQSLASMALPAFTIHSVVKYSGRALKETKNPRVRTWGPIGLGLAVVPLLPYIFDEPVKEAVEWAFRVACRSIPGENAVQPSFPLSPSPSGKSMPPKLPGNVEDQKKQLDGVPEEKHPDQEALASWEEYKEEKLRAREQRKREREERSQTSEGEGQGGRFGLWGASNKDDKKEKGE